MSLFNRGKKKEETECCCAGGEGSPADNENARVKVLGGGCAKCNALEASAKAALSELGMDPAVGHITDFGEIAACGVMNTPALMVDGKVVSAGRVLKTEEIVKILQKVQ